MWQMAGKGKRGIRRLAQIAQLLVSRRPPCRSRRVRQHSNAARCPNGTNGLCNRGGTHPHGLVTTTVKVSTPSPTVPLIARGSKEAADERSSHVPVTSSR